jgi:hypothetical protein
MKENKILSGINKKNYCSKHSESNYIMGGSVMENAHYICMGKKIGPFMFVGLFNH